MKKKVTRRIIALFLVVVMSFGGFQGLFYHKVSVAKDESAIQISTLDDFLKIQSNPRGNYILMNDIDLSPYAKGGSADTGHGWKPIKFSGKLNGNGHRINNLNIYGTVETKDDELCVGLFSEGREAKISNLGLTNVNIDIQLASVKDHSDPKKVHIGALIGGEIQEEDEEYSVDQIYVDGSIKVDGAYSGTGTYYYIGGIAGDASHISNCFNNASVVYTGKENNGEVRLGGVSGGGNLVNCINYGKVDKSVGKNLGSVVGSTENWCSGINCYYLDNNVDSKDAREGFTCLTDYSMKMEGSFKNFDFDYIWVIDPESTFAYPQLKGNLYDRVTGLSMVEKPIKSTYAQGEMFDPTGAKLSVTYEKSGVKSVDLKKEWIRGYHPYIIGTQNIKMVFGGHEIPFDVLVDSSLPPIIKEDAYDYVLAPNSKVEKPIQNNGVSLAFESSNTQVVLVGSETGIIESIREGASIVRATADNGIYKDYTVLVGIMTKSVELNKTSVDLSVGETESLSASLKPKDATFGVSWSSTNTDVATVENGLITAVSGGSADIKAVSCGIEAICHVTVKSKEADTGGDGQSISGKPARVTGFKMTKRKQKVKGKTILVWNTFTWKKVQGCDGYRFQVYHDYNGDSSCWDQGKGWLYKDLKKNKNKVLVCDYYRGEYDCYCKVRVCAYVKKNGKRVYGKWSKVLKTDWNP